MSSKLTRQVLQNESTLNSVSASIQTMEKMSLRLESQVNNKLDKLERTTNLLLSFLQTEQNAKRKFKALIKGQEKFSDVVGYEDQDEENGDEGDQDDQGTQDETQEETKEESEAEPEVDDDDDDEEAKELAGDDDEEEEEKKEEENPTSRTERSESKRTESAKPSIKFEQYADLGGGGRINDTADKLSDEDIAVLELWDTDTYKFPLS